MLSARRRRGPTPASRSLARGQRAPHQEANAWMATPPGVPRRRRPVGPQFLEHSRYPVGTKGGDRTAGAQGFDERTESLAVSTTSASSQVTAGEERLHRTTATDGT